MKGDSFILHIALFGKMGKYLDWHVLKKQQFISSLTHGDQSYIFGKKMEMEASRSLPCYTSQMNNHQLVEFHLQL